MGQSEDTQPLFIHTSEAELHAHCGFCCSQVPLVQQSHREPQDSFPLRPNPYSNCGNFPDAILTGEYRPLLVSVHSVFASGRGLDHITVYK